RAGRGARARSAARGAVGVRAERPLARGQGEARAVATRDGGDGVAYRRRIARGRRGVADPRAALGARSGDDSLISVARPRVALPGRASPPTRTRGAARCTLRVCDSPDPLARPKLAVPAFVPRLLAASTIGSSSGRSALSLGPHSSPISWARPA